MAYRLFDAELAKSGYPVVARRRVTASDRRQESPERVHAPALGSIHS